MSDEPDGKAALLNDMIDGDGSGGCDLEIRMQGFEIQMLTKLRTNQNRQALENANDCGLSREAASVNASANEQLLQ